MTRLFQMTNQAPYTLTWDIAEEYSGMSIKEFLKRQGVSKRALTDIKFTGGSIKVNGHTENVLYKLYSDDRLEVVFPEEIISKHVEMEDIPLAIVYEDQDIIVIDKPPFMNTIPSREHPTGSIANALAGHYEKIGVRSTIHIATRLDRNTSGLVLAAKHRHAHHLLGLMQKAQHLHRIYEGLAAGQLKERTGTIDAPIGRKPDSIIEREVREDGKRSVTHFERIKQLSEFSHVKLHLETGRTHQIRVHLSHIGHPLLGDDLYGGSKDKIKRQALHCSELNFVHPLKKTDFTFHSQLPDDISKLLI